MSTPLAGATARPDAWRQLRMVWSSAWAGRPLARHRWWPAALLALLLLGAPALAGWLVDRVLAAIVLWGVVAVLAVMVWITLLSNTLRQNHPTLARLVPGHVPALRRSLWTAAAPLVLLIGMMPAVGLLAPDGRPLLRIVMGLALMVSGACGFLVVMALLMRWPMASPLFIVVLLLLTASGTVLAPLVQTYVHGGEASWWALALAAALLVAGLLRLVVLDGGPRHRSAHRRLPGLGLQPQASAEAAVQQWGVTRGGWVALLTGRSLYGRYLLRRLQQGRPELALGLPPDLHPVGAMAARLPGQVVLLALMLVVGLGLQGLAVQAAFKPGLLGAYLGSSLVALVYLRMVYAMRAAHGEQALLRLLPGAPQGAYLNRWLARQTATSALAMLLVTVPGGLLALLLMDALSGTWWQFAQACWWLSLASLPLLWRDWSRDDPALARSSGDRSLLPLLLLLAANGAAVLFKPELLPWLWTVELAGGAAWALWCWRRLSRLPSAWPVGHARGWVGR